MPAGGPVPLSEADVRVVDGLLHDLADRAARRLHLPFAEVDGIAQDAWVSILERRRQRSSRGASASAFRRPWLRTLVNRLASTRDRRRRTGPRVLGDLDRFEAGAAFHGPLPHPRVPPKHSSVKRRVWQASAMALRQLTTLQREAVMAWRYHGGVKPAARALGLAPKTIRERLQRANHRLAGKTRVREPLPSIPEGFFRRRPGYWKTAYVLARAGRSAEFIAAVTRRQVSQVRSLLARLRAAST